jgi:tRNA U34 5-methylaminomethyl-2-thiouridine-forming methyltransferase MnmC
LLSGRKQALSIVIFTVLEMKKVLTKDGSFTFFNEKLGEHYHSKSGAEKEAVEKFSRPSGVTELAAERDEVLILDICFGLGYNTAAAIDMIREHNSSCRVTVYAFESDPEILSRTGEVGPSFLSYELIRIAAQNLAAEEGGRRIQIFPGDVRDEIKLVPKGVADAVLFDPFSPIKAPHLWTEGFFKDIYERMKPGARLVTYSCADKVRRAMKAAGFKVSDGPCIGRRNPSTIAVKPL